jgi:hypothetical protein
MESSLGDRGATGFLLYTAILAVPLGLLFSIPIFRTVDKTVPLTVSEITLALLTISYFARFQANSRSLLKRVPDGRLVVGFGAWAAISLAIAAGRFSLGAWEAAVSAMYLVRWVGYALFYFVTYEAAVNRQIARRIFKCLLEGGIAFAIFGLVQAILFPPNFALWLHPGARPFIDYDPQGHRLVSTFMEPNQAAGFISIFATVVLSFCVNGFRRWTWVFVVLATALLATLSRGGIFGFVVGALFLLFSARSSRWRGAKMMLLFLAVSLAVYPLLVSEMNSQLRLNLYSGDSLMNRIGRWEADLRAIVLNPVSGIGFDTLGYVGPRYGVGPGEGNAAFGVSGDLLMIPLLTGIVGLAIYVGILKGMLPPLSNLGRNGLDAWDRAFGRGVWAASLGAVASSFFTTTFVYPPIMAVLWTLWAIGRRLDKDIALRTKLHRSTPSPVAPSGILADQCSN